MRQKRTPTFTEQHTMYNLFPLMARTAILAVIPKTIDVIHAAVVKKVHKQPEPQLKQIRRRRLKKVDTTPLTKMHYDIVMERHGRMIQFNEGLPMSERITTTDLTEGLNKEFGLDKSITAYSNFWRGAVSRESLPDGETSYRTTLNAPTGGRYLHLVN